MNKITAIIPTLNEEIHIKDAIKSVNFADEIIVIDSFSSDNTLAIAKEYNVKIIKRKFDDFSSQKNFAIRHAKNDWIYILDADERVTPLVRKEIINALAYPKHHYVGFYVQRAFYFLGKELRYGGCQRDKVVRLFNRKYCKYDGKKVHETIKANGKLGFFKNKINHYSFRNYDHYISKMNHYATLKSEIYLDNNNYLFLPYHLVLKPFFRFFIHYIIRLGFLDGISGFVFAKCQAYGVYTRYVKYYILKKRSNNAK